MRTTFAIPLLVLATCGLAYYVVALWSAFVFRRGHDPSPTTLTPPAVSILKPLKGADREIYSSFRSHCIQNYENYEIIFGVNDLDDAAVPLVKQLMAEFPGPSIRLVACPEVLGMNRKVSNLIQMLRHARHDHVIVNDSDIKVSPDYLQNVTSHFADPRVGLVTCPYRGAAGPDLGSRLESLGISTDFIPGVLTASHLESGIHFGLGSTLAISRAALQAIGGFESIVDHLADDFELGARISKAGFKVGLAHEVVETLLPRYTLAKFFEHQLRWSRSTRDSRRGGYLGLGVTYAVPWAMLSVLAAPHWKLTWILLITVLLARLALALLVGRGILADRTVARRLWLLPLRDVVALGVWAWSYAGDTVTWRGEKFLLKNGRMYPLSRSDHDRLHPVGSAPDSF
jgi:ceramide glucosyltransferase